MALLDMVNKKNNLFGTPGQFNLLGQGNIPQRAFIPNIARQELMRNRDIMRPGTSPPVYSIPRPVGNIGGLLNRIGQGGLPLGGANIPPPIPINSGFFPPTAATPTTEGMPPLLSDKMNRLLQNLPFLKDYPIMRRFWEMLLSGQTPNFIRGGGQ